ncbi:MAG: DUF3450 domain-containing protein [Cellvibrionaceae bacterium]
MANRTVQGQTLPRRRLGLLGAYSLLLSVALSAGATSFADILAAEKAAVKEGVASQQRIDQVDDERAELVGEYRGAVRQQEDLVKYNNQLRSVVESQEKEAASFNEQLQRVSHLESDIVPLMSDMLDALEKFIALDAPFLPRERRNRVAKLRELFGSDVSSPEKYQRILEAYQIENDYGRTIESYDAPLPDNAAGGEQVVSFLKVGRAVFLYQTLDGKNSFYWRPEERQWLPLEQRFNQPVRRGIQMAREQIPSDLLLLPVLMPTVMPPVMPTVMPQP